MTHYLAIVVGGDEDTLLDLLPKGEGTADGDADLPFDYYVLGGRWCGYFPLRPGRTGRLGELDAGDGIADPADFPGRASAALLGDIDLEGMRRSATERAARCWDTWHAAVGGLPPDRSVEELEAEVQAEVERARRFWQRRRPDDVRRQTYARAQAEPRVVALKAAFSHFDPDEVDVWASPEAYDRDLFVECEALSQFAGAAVYRDGKWVEAPWIDGDGSETTRWLQTHGQWPEDYPPHTMVAAVDCHL